MSNTDQRTVLLGWECGAGLGHVQKLRCVASALLEHGFRPVLAVKDLVGPRSLLTDLPFPILQAPVYSGLGTPAPAGFQAANFADILTFLGFSDAGHLFALTQGWQALLDLVRPALVIADYSPSLLLAAYGTFPAVRLGTGFCVPPALGPEFPPLVPDRAPLVAHGELLAIVQTVQRRRGKPFPPALTSMDAATRTFVTVLPEPDPYRQWRREPVVGPLEPVGPPLPRPPQPCFFAYLSAEVPACEAVLASLARTGIPGRAYVRGADAAARERLRYTGVEILDRARSPSEALAESSVVVSHGGAGLAQAALGAGRPQLLFPTYLEQILNAQALEQLGVGISLGGTLSVAQIGSALQQLVADPRYSQRAREQATEIESRKYDGALTALVTHCCRCLEQPIAAREQP